MDMLAALRLQIAWGADEALEEAPLDRTHPPALARAPAPPAPAVPRQEASGPVARARLAAAQADSLEALRAAMAGFDGFPLATTATKLVFGDGDARAGLVVVGEAPGPEDDLAGVPFAGADGRFLERMFASIGLGRGDMWLTTLIAWRPPGNRPPSETEIQTCLAFLHRQLALKQPRLLVTLGALPARALTGRDEAIRRLRGRWQEVRIPGLDAPVPLLPILHPAYIRQNAGAKRDTWADLIAIRGHLNRVC
jgi:DNA polymerase